MTRQSAALEYLALAAIWGSSFLFMRLGGAEFGVMATAGVRVMIGALVLLPILWFSGHWDSLRRHAGPVLFIGMLNSGLPFALFAYAVTSISTGLAGILNATVPLFGAVIAWLWLKDRPGPARVAGLAIGFLGVVLLAKDSASFKPGGSGWAFRNRRSSRARSYTRSDCACRSPCTSRSCRSRARSARAVATAIALAAATTRCASRADCTGRRYHLPG